jgi:hypothetical protein
MAFLITVTEAVRSFAEIIGRVYHKGEAFDIKKGTPVVAHLSSKKKPATLSASNLNEFFDRAPSLGKEEAESFLKNLEHSENFIKNNDVKWD